MILNTLQQGDLPMTPERQRSPVTAIGVVMALWLAAGSSSSAATALSSGASPAPLASPAPAPAATLSSGAAPSPAAARPPADPARIVVKDFMFTPTSVTVKAGTTVTWANLDDEPHTVVSDAGLFRSNALDTNETFSFRFDKPGTYRFVCSIHPRMLGIIVVQ